MRPNTLETTMRITDIITDNGAVLAGYTQEFFATSNNFDIHISVKPDADLLGTIWAFDHDEQQMININAWYFKFEPVTVDL